MKQNRISYALAAALVSRTVVLQRALERATAVGCACGDTKGRAGGWAREDAMPISYIL